MAAPAAFSLEGINLCIGTWAWGTIGGFNSPWVNDDKNTDDSHRQAFQASMAAGLTMFDTAEIYNNGKSEELLGQFIKELPAGSPRVIVATKFMPFPYRIRQACLKTALMDSLARLKLPFIDLYQVHGPALSARSVEVWADALAEVYKEGLIKGVGVSNYNSDQVRRTHAALAKHGIPLLSNQIEYSLLHRLPETTGLINTCAELGVKILAYSPLAMGRLTGKYTTEEQLKKLNDRQFGQAPLSQLLPLLDKMREIGLAHGGKTCAQVALNWVLKKGAIPIMGCKNAAQAQDNAGAIGWLMTDQECQALDGLSTPGNLTWWGKIWGPQF